MFLSQNVNNVALVDSLKRAAQNNSDPSWIMHHVLDGHSISFEPFGTLLLPQFHIFGFDLSITKHVFFIFLIAAILILIALLAARSYKKSIIPKGFANLFEVLILFVRDEIVAPSIGKGYETYLPYLLTLFFFILLSNLFGLIPYSVTITGNIAVTAALASISFIVTQFAGIKSHGTIKYFKGLVPSGMPKLILIIIIPLEILGLFTKPFALCIRLFANMIAGHIVIFSLLGLIFIMHSIYVAPVSVGFALFIELLELLVAVIQAYIFTMLTALFIGMSVHSDH